MATSSSLVRMEHLSELRLSRVDDIENLLDSNILELPSLQSLYLNDFAWTVQARHALWATFQAYNRTLSTIKLTITSAIPVAEASIDMDATPITLDSVTHFTIHGHPNCYSLLRLLSLPHVQELVMEEIPFDIIHPFMSASSASLRDISLYPWGGALRADAPISFPSLTVLRVHNIPELLDHFHASQLKHLDLRTTYFFLSFDEPFLHDFIERSSPRLLSLILSHAEMSDDYLIKCMERLSHLEELVLLNCSIADSFLQALATLSAEPEPAWLLPRLKNIVLAHCDGLTPRGIIAFLTSRNAASSNPMTGTSPSRVTGKMYFEEVIDERDCAAIQSLGVEVLLG